MEKLAINWNSLEGIATPTLGTSATIGDIISKVLPLVLSIAGMILLFYLILAGYQYMMSQGDPKAMATARSNITYAVIGFVVVFSAYVIVQLFAEGLQLKTLKDIFSK